MTLPLTHQIVKYGSIVFVVGLTSLFFLCTRAIYQMVKPLQDFTDAELAERAIGGLGIHLVKTIMDSVDYERTENGYNRLATKKKLKIKD